MTWWPPGAHAVQEPDAHYEVRRQLIALIRKGRREARWTPTHPADLRFAEVLHPESGLPVTRSTAWHLIIDLLEAGVPLEQRVLDQPAGTTGWVLKATLRGQLYVKMQITGNRVLLRSFHP